MSEVPGVSLAELQKTGEVKGERTASQIVKEKLRPTEFVDDDGTRREVFNFTSGKKENVQVVFYSKEELPSNKDLVKGKQVFVLGGPTKFRAEGEWKQFLNDLATHSDNKSGVQNLDSLRLDQVLRKHTGLFFVENTPENMLDMAFILGLEDKELRDARGKMTTDKTYTPQVLSIIDSMIAGTAVDDDMNLRGPGKGLRVDQRGEALTLLALLGDEEAREVLDEKRAVVDQSDLRRQGKVLDWASRRSQELEAEGIKTPQSESIYHVTKYKPKMSSNGEVELWSTYDATDGKSLRNTIHLSLAGPITDLLGGNNWTEADYIIRGDLGEVRDLNGNPRVMSEVDTYFSMSPSTRLKVPNAHVTMPGVLPNGVVREVRGNVTLYKKGPYSPEDIDSFLMDKYDGWGRSNERANEEIEGRVFTHG